MKRKGTESESKPTQVTQVTAPPITESTAPPATKVDSSAPPVETVTAPPISETTTAAPPATKPAEATTPLVEASAPPISELETIANTETQPPANEPTTAATLPPPGRGSRTFEDYLKLDWTKSNSDLATECGVSRQAIAQMRRKVEQHKANGGKMPTFDDVTKPAETITQKVVDYDAMAGMVFDMSAGILTMTFGDEWQPKPAEQPGKPGERDIVCNALAGYFRSKEVADIPPGLMLTVVCVAYAGGRIRHPNTANKLKLAWQWTKVKLGSLMSWFRKKKA